MFKYKMIIKTKLKDVLVIRGLSYEATIMLKDMIMTRNPETENKIILPMFTVKTSGKRFIIALEQISHVEFRKTIFGW